MLLRGKVRVRGAKRGFYEMTERHETLPELMRHLRATRQPVVLEIEKLLGLVAEADSHISWCQHRHLVDEDHNQEMRDWVIRARKAQKARSTP